MSTLQTILAIIGGLFALTTLIAGLWVAARVSVRDAQMTRLRAENEDLIRRLDWIEPRHKQVEEKNELLMQLHNPTERLEALSSDQRRNHEQILAALREQSSLLHQIDEQLPRRGAGDGS